MERLIAKEVENSGMERWIKMGENSGWCVRSCKPSGEFAERNEEFLLLERHSVSNYGVASCTLEAQYTRREGVVSVKRWSLLAGDPGKLRGLRSSIVE